MSAEWNDFQERLAASLRHVTDRVFLIVASGDDARRYVQYTAVSDVLHGEAPGTDIVADADAAVLAASVWREPEAGQPLWTTSRPLPALTTEYRALAMHSVRLLRHAYGISSPSILRYRAWREAELPPAGARWSAKRRAQLDTGEARLEMPFLGLDTF